MRLVQEHAFLALQDPYANAFYDPPQVWGCLMLMLCVFVLLYMGGWEVVKVIHCGLWFLSS